ncbi:YopX family protein [Sporosarcina newyorkensis]|uniref:YopX family protein n=1 Tax=Sporosarcina newyorkensis TaxID=759851 RepID=UPI003CFF855E
MREIKVRGYAVEEMVGSQWMYGTGVHITEFTDEYAERTGKKEEVFIWTESGWVEVFKESVSQYTGLKDIYESDIVTVQTRYGMDKGVVVFKDGAFMVYWDSNINFPRNGAITNYYYLNDKNKVLGNIYENPELLAGGTN